MYPPNFHSKAWKDDIKEVQQGQSNTRSNAITSQGAQREKKIFKILLYIQFYYQIILFQCLKLNAFQ
jgi:hypothetical protein